MSAYIERFVKYSNAVREARESVRRERYPHREKEALSLYVGTEDYLKATLALADKAPGELPLKPGEGRILLPSESVEEHTESGGAILFAPFIEFSVASATDVWAMIGDCETNFEAEFASGIDALAFNVVNPFADSSLLGTVGVSSRDDRVFYFALDGYTPVTLDAIRLAIWVLQNPDLVEKKPRDLRSKAEIRQRNKSRPDRPRLVTIVDLRAAHREAAADVAAAERTYRSRWIVRGHWHRFWTGPRDGERKLETRYVMPYVKGPAGAPLNVTERVKKW